MKAYRVSIASDEERIVDCPDCKGMGWVFDDDKPMDGYYAPQVYGEPYNDRAECDNCGGSGSIDQDDWEDGEDASND